MSQTTQPSGLSRRSALASVLAATCAALPAVATAATGKDAALLALYRKFCRVNAQIQAIDDAPEYEFGSYEERQREARTNDLCRQEGQMVRKMAEIPACSPSGLKVKAAVLQTLLPGILRDCYIGEDSAEMHLVMSLLGDLTGGAQI
ncbi:hypothetical protein [Acetobacter orientalis]|uniref:Uncharacterized protein n=1 Tax=Acetobacter orientalis TaxID=146474 RepID=A0A251ZZY7_9PROT|nr:hypothetical protein [Acetobacter orientalis]OUI80375.1 hypothetical protein HK12_08820 [Acetobacter orientalis]